MEEIKKLLSKYWEDTASESELRELLSRLDYEEKDIREVLEKEFAGKVQEEDDIRIRRMAKAVLERVNQQIDAQEPIHHPTGERGMVLRPVGEQRGKLFKKLALMAAAMAGIVFCFQLLNRRDIRKSMPVVRSSPVAKGGLEIKQVVNKTSQPENIRLEDGSMVVLYPNSSLSYKQPFDSLRRNIDMRGKALFKVAGDIKRPFTVITGNLATTALGTEFLVSVQPGSDKISVRLLEGKVVIRTLAKEASNNLLYLKPGEELTINQGLTKYEIKPFTGGSGKRPQIRQAEEINVLSFSREPLLNVLKTIEKIYHVKIRYRENVLRKLSFTGEFFPSDSLEIVIAAICNANDLSFEEKEGVITIISGK